MKPRKAKKAPQKVGRGRAASPSRPALKLPPALRKRVLELVPPSPKNQDPPSLTRRIEDLEKGRLDQILVIKKLSELLKEVENDTDAHNDKIRSLETLWLEKISTRLNDFGMSLAKLHDKVAKVEKLQLARDDAELASYTRQVTRLDSDINGMKNNIRAYDNRIVEAEAKVANAAQAAEPALVSRILNRVQRLEALSRFTGTYSDAVETFKNGSIKS